MWEDLHRTYEGDCDSESGNDSRILQSRSPSEHTPMTNTDIDLLQYEKSPEAKRIPDDHFLLGLDRQSGEPFGNAAFRSLDATLCASYDGVSMLAHGKAVLFPLSWLYAEYPKERKLWKAQCAALRKYAKENGLPFIERRQSQSQRSPWRSIGIKSTTKVTKVRIPSSLTSPFWLGWRKSH
jgi:hypothetical protein